jgi:hypothetical protein
VAVVGLSYVETSYAGNCLQLQFTSGLTNGEVKILPHIEVTKQGTDFKYNYNYQVKEDEMGGHVARMGRRGMHIGF